jgi:hypothetical protein
VYDGINQIHLIAHCWIQQHSDPLLTFIKTNNLQLLPPKKRLFLCFKFVHPKEAIFANFCTKIQMDFPPSLVYNARGGWSALHPQLRQGQWPNLLQLA